MHLYYYYNNYHHNPLGLYNFILNLGKRYYPVNRIGFTLINNHTLYAGFKIRGQFSCKR